VGGRRAPPAAAEGNRRSVAKRLSRSVQR
jgi:hypothetical protein